MKNEQYDKVLRGMGYVDSGLSSSRGNYFICSYRPSARKKKVLPEGLVEVHSFGNRFKVVTKQGEFSSLKSAVEGISKASTLH